MPTGGGKTFLAANAIEPIFHALGVIQQRVVVWLVPSDAILAQTLAALRNPAHPYRQKIDVAFNSRVEIYTKDQLLSGTVGADSGHSHPSGGGCRPHRPAANHQPASPGGDRGRKPSCPQHSEQADAPGLQPSLCAGLDCYP